MSIIYFLLPLALLLGFGFAASFLKMVLQGQYDELETPAHRILLEDERVVERTPMSNERGKRS